MEEYERLGHMSEVNDNNDSDRSYFLPHHGVINEDSLTTKLRTVFDGSAVTSSGKSLNDILLRGPPIQNDIFEILIRFRLHAVVVTADVTKMYRCVLVHPSDRYLQKKLWRFNPSKPVKEYELNTLTYGTVCAPFLAIRCLKQIAMDNFESFPVASKIIAQDFYVDDLLTGFDNEMDAIQFSQQMFAILSTASFVLRKWNSNSLRVLEEFSNSFHLDSLGVLDLGINDQVKTLGVQWASKTDVLSYKINVETAIGSRNLFKRLILSEITKIYDPLGLVSPSIILVKILIQKLWLLKLTETRVFLQKEKFLGLVLKKI